MTQKNNVYIGIIGIYTINLSRGSNRKRKQFGECYDDLNSNRNGTPEICHSDITMTLNAFHGASFVEPNSWNWFDPLIECKVPLWLVEGPPQ